ncbi:MAG TPA: hypothetical protein PLD47_10510 [Aggregatilineales bacterium]|nr:hypothetical protein [Anaerolineales bacterium]HRE48146.1 hypothetical protein [Aggregatilineales bacterium]
MVFEPRPRPPVLPLSDAAFQPLAIGVGRLAHEGTGGAITHLILDHAGRDRYSNAQLDNYWVGQGKGFPRRHFPCAPPIRLTMRAWASHAAADMRGTAGFGFWNHPYMPGERFPRLPRYAWFFFGGAPHNMALARGVPGGGWKAAVGSFQRPAFLALAPTAPLGFLLMRVPPLYRALWGIGQWAVGVREAHLDPEVIDWREPHEYRLDWLVDRLQWYIDGRLVLESPLRLRGRMGCVIWHDNQYAILTPQGQIGFGLVAIPARQTFSVAGISLTALG